MLPAWFGALLTVVFIAFALVILACLYKCIFKRSLTGDIRTVKRAFINNLVEDQDKQRWAQRSPISDDE